jgi:hypothetical protein
MSIKKQLLAVFAVAAAACFAADNPAARAAIDGEPGRPPADSCRNVSFVVRNGRNVAIKIKKVKYYNGNERRWQTEDLKYGNSDCEPGSMCFPGSLEDLRDSEGDDITAIIFLYEDVNDSTMRESQQFFPSAPTCRAGKEYGFGQGWTIGGTSRPEASGDSDALGDACKNVSFIVQNHLSTDIDIVKVKYYNRNSGKWKTEDVANNFCQIGTKCTVGGKDNLADANNDDLTKIIFIYYRRKGYQRVGDEIESKSFVPKSPKCLEKKVYGTGQGWKIE